MDATPFALGLLASLATSLGGLLALRAGRRLGLILALAAGVVLGVALFELIPEALLLAGEQDGRGFVVACVAAGFVLLVMVDRLLRHSRGVGPRLRPHLAPASLTFHSLVDGAGIALAYQLAPEIGWSVAVAVLSHDFADGANVVGSALPRAGPRAARLWLLVNGLAPLVGVAITYWVTVPPRLLIALLAGLAGAFVYIGVSELLLRSYRMDRRIGTTATSALGFALVYVGTRFA